MRFSDKFVSLSQCDIRTNIDTLKSIRLIYAITRLDFIILPFFPVLTGKKSGKIYIEYEPEFLSRYQPEPEQEPELKYRRLQTLTEDTLKCIFSQPILNGVFIFAEKSGQ